MKLDVIYNEDCLEGMKRLPNDSIDLVATDPPYFRVKRDSWDRQWDNQDRFIDWIGWLCKQWQRILKPNGSLYVFASPQMSARVEVTISQVFRPLNRIRWIKSEGWHNKARPEDLRSFLSPWEEIIFAEHYGSDSIAKGESVGYAAKCDQLRGFLFEPIRSYLVQEFKASRIDPIQFNVICGFSPIARGMASRHYLSSSQWCLPTPEHYAQLASATGRFKRPYEELRQQYEELRRPFAVSPRVPFTDVWTFPTVRNYPGKHPCEKPVSMIEHIVNTSSRESSVVLDCCMGSGTTAIACINTGRHYIGFEKDPKYFAVAQKRISDHQPPLIHKEAA